MRSYDFVIVGAGIVGLTVAREIAKRRLGRICLLEKEASLGMHTSGRNSGVVHAGVYYVPNSLKARFCVEGARRMLEYANANGISFKKTGKVIVTSYEKETPELEKLLQRALSNGVKVEKIDSKRLREIEPEAQSVGPALFSPNTAVIDSKSVLFTLARELRSLGVELVQSTKVCQPDLKSRMISVSSHRIQYGHLINAAGLEADQLAHRMGVGEHYRILPFKGIYHKLRPEAAVRFRGSIYPTPDPSMPFLGVHITRTVHDEVIVGPTAMPALGRENYGILKGMRLGEVPRLAKDLLSMIIKNKNGMRNMVRAEFLKYNPSHFLKAVRKLAPFIQKEDLLPSAKVGIRAQLIDERKMEFVMDFLIEEGPHSTHILNVVSPGFTSGFAFAEEVVDQITMRRAA